MQLEIHDESKRKPYYSKNKQLGIWLPAKLRAQAKFVYDGFINACIFGVENRGVCTNVK